MIDAVASHILALPIWAALALVFVIPALESSAFVGFIFPGEVALILGGVLAYEGHTPLVAVLATGIVGAIVGDSIGYLVGRRYGRGLLEGTLGRFISHKHFDRAEAYLAGRGGRAVFFGRFTAALRVMLPGLAGMSRMHYRKFALYNVAGGAAWGSLCVLLGYLGGSSWQRVVHLASRVGLLALVVVILAFGGGYLLRLVHRGRVGRRATSADEIPAGDGLVRPVGRPGRADRLVLDVHASCRVRGHLEPHRCRSRRHGTRRAPVVQSPTARVGS